ncbi:MAG: asparagine synthase (glutamine-hydrolyzing) [Thermoanaerobaculia bacterium]|nr:asparagine synthase (glutamine-hydrolyzing) [Thermoanaerobaculia bacterium]
MCGIVGIVGAPEPAPLEQMTDDLAHRGPDDRGVWRGDGAEIGHTRLSILDLSTAGRQPMELGPHVLTYNGEIYNFRELRRSLPGPFLSDSDTEVLLHLLAHEGPGCLHRLRGMFALAIWDRRERRLFAARDRLGIKPLLYRELPGGGLAFASEIRPLLELGRPPVDRTALRDYFTYKYVPEPKTIYQGIRKLPPAHCLTWQSGRLEVRRWWEPASRPPVVDPDAAIEELGELLAQAVPEHTVSDVPVAVFLSGGIDSTTIVAHLDRPRTFTLGTDVKRRDESVHARRIAEHFGTRHQEATAGAVDLDEALDTIPRIFGEPFGDTGAWATYLVSRLARRHVTVALSGEGGDEIFCGYQWYSKWITDRSTLLLRWMAALAPPFASGARSAQRRTSRGLERYGAFLGPFTGVQRRALLGPALELDGYDDLWHFRRHWREELPPVKRMQWADLHTYLPGQLLTKVDRASMAHSLEVRPPLLDHRLVELTLALDPSLLHDVERGRGKVIVRRLMEPRIPEGFFDRPKRGFNLPFKTWVRKRRGLLDGALDRLADARVIRRPRRPALTNEQTWTLLSLDRWLTASGAGW